MHDLLYKKVNIKDINNNKKYEFIRQIQGDFKESFLSLNENQKRKVKKIIMNELDFSNYFKLDLYDKIFSNDYKNNFESLSSVVILFALRDKINQKSFLNELKRNYGICINAENIIEDLKKKIKNDEYMKNCFEIFGKYKYLNKIKDIIVLYIYVKMLKFDIFYLRFPYYRRFKHVREEVEIYELKKKNYEKKQDRDIVKRERKIIKFSCDKTYNKELLKKNNY